MKFQGVISILATTVILFGCNEDMASNRSQSAFRPPVVTEPVGVYSGIHRERGTSPVTYISEIGLSSTHQNLRPIPDMRLDDDGGDGVNVTKLQIRPDKLCGLDIKATLAEKIGDCATKNTDKAIWNGTLNAGSAESTWVLVMLAEKSGGSETFETWIDKRTGMVWSEIVNADGNWCEASGSELLPSDHVGINCAITGKGGSICTKYDPAELPKVTWRLPTRHDYLQADIDGIRFVLHKGTTTLWTATTTSDVTARDKAWTYNMVTGTLVAELMETARNVRCIGTPNF
jgi:hypothetical protein